MASKLAITEEELDESLYWLDLLVEAGDIRSEAATDLTREGEEILRILVASIRTLRGMTDGSQVRERRAPYMLLDADEASVEDGVLL